MKVLFLFIGFTCIAQFRTDLALHYFAGAGISATTYEASRRVIGKPAARIYMIRTLAETSANKIFCIHVTGLFQFIFLLEGGKMIVGSYHSNNEMFQIIRAHGLVIMVFSN